MSPDTESYVNQATGSDTLDTGRGESASKPFKTIQAAINYVTDNYNVSRYQITININPGTYTETLSLPQYSVTTGRIILQGTSKDAVIVQGNYNGSGNTILVNVSSFATWVIRNITLSRTVTIASSTTYIDGIRVNIYGSLTIIDVIFNISQQCEQIQRIRIINIGGSIDIGNGCKINGTYTQISDKQNTIAAMVVYDGGKISYEASEETEYLNISGDFSVICEANGGRFIRNFNYSPAINGVATGKRYAVYAGGSIDAGNGGSEYFPGSTAGTVQSETYSWYS